MGCVDIPHAREIGRLIPQCPACEGDNYLAVFHNSDAGFFLQALRCERCQEDILAFFLRLPSSVREVHSEKKSPAAFEKILTVACSGAAALIGWLILADLGWV